MEISFIMDALYRHRAPSLPVEALADIFDRMIYCLDDEGAAVLQVREDWLVSDELDRVKIALAMEETFPFNDPKTMGAVFHRIVTKWPQLEATCRSIQEERRTKYPDEQ